MDRREREAWPKPVAKKGGTERRGLWLGGGGAGTEGAWLQGGAGAEWEACEGAWPGLEGGVPKRGGRGISGE